MAQQINRAEAMYLGPRPGPRTSYAPFAKLANVPATPDGFSLQFHVDGLRYAFSLKDSRDACRYAIFSDQDRFIYEATPQLGVKVVPAEIP